MIPSLSTGLRAGAACLFAAAWSLGTDAPAWAQQPPPPVFLAPAPEPEPGPTAMTTPALTGPLVANPKPWSFDAGWLNTIYFTGAISGLTLSQSDHIIGDQRHRIDLSNGQFSLQNTEGVFQFYVQGGAYSFPSLGLPYFPVAKTTGDFFGPVPVAYAKLVPNDTVSIQVGKLPTLIGAEYAFTFQNMNIERGLLWNQEPIISRGIQFNYTAAPLTLSFSLNDGFYSDSYNWMTGLAAWTINKENTLTVVGGGNFGQTSKNVLKSPLLLNNSQIFNLIYTYNSAPWTITPYFQYTHVPSSPFLGFTSDASTIGGAILANYSINDNVNLAGRVEYIGSTGGGTSPNLLYGPGSSAMSFTMTPTWQNGIYFLRSDVSVVHASSTTAGLAFGKAGNTRTQARFLLETGIIF